jgi:hypothetical protein
MAGERWTVYRRRRIMEPVLSNHSVSGPVALFTYLNGALFGLGAITHIGVPIGPLQEPAVVPAMMIEALCTIVIAVATMGFFTRAAWARRLALFSHSFALLGSAMVAVILALDAEGTSGAGKVLQTFRAAVALVCVVMLARRRLDESLHP